MTREQFRPDDHPTDAFLLTTVVGSYPRPAWFDAIEEGAVDEDAARHEAADDCARLIIHEHERSGIDVVTDGEVRRGGMVEHFTPFIEGYSTGTGTDDADWNAHMPTVDGTIASNDPWLVDDFLFTDQVATRPVKVTLPGPFTFSSFCSLDAYDDMEVLIDDFAEAVRGEAARLVDAGATWIQIDEPALGMSPHVEIGRRCLEHIATAVPDHVRLGLHVCSGNYDRLAPAIFDFPVDEVDLEFASDNADSLDAVLGDVERSVDVGVGVVDSQDRTIESVERIEANIKTALRFVPPDRLTLTPDCGLKPLPRRVAFEKLSNLATAARRVEADIDAARVETALAD